MKRLTTALLCVLAIQSANAISVRNIKLETGKHLNDVVSVSEALTLDSICITGGVLDRDDYAFLSHCSENGKLSGIDLSRATTENDEIPDWAFRPSKINGAPHRATSKEDFFGNLHYIRLPHNTYRIGEQAFLSTCLRKIEIPKTVRMIGESAFADCDDLREVTVCVADAATLDAEYAFDESAANTTLVVPSGSGGSYSAESAWKHFGKISEKPGLYVTRHVSINSGNLEQALGEDLFTTDSLVITGSLNATDFKTLRKGIYSGILTGINLAGCTLENNAVPEEAFACDKSVSSELDCNLLYVTLPEGVTSIGNGAFADCWALQGIQIPQSVTYIGEDAFYDCIRTRGIATVPEGVSRLSASTFENCLFLSGVNLPSTLSILDPSSLKIIDAELGKGGWSATFRVNRMTPPKAASMTENSHTPFGYTEAALDKVLGTSVLYVPMGAKSAYEADETWKHFGTIIETSELDGGATGITATVANENPQSADNRVYSIDGRYIGNNAKNVSKGIYVVNGKKVAE